MYGYEICSYTIAYEIAPYGGKVVQDSSALDYDWIVYALKVGIHGYNAKL